MRVKCLCNEIVSVSSLKRHQLFTCPLFKVIVVAEAMWYTKDLPYSKAVNTILGNKNPSTSDQVAVDSFPFYGIVLYYFFI